MTHPAEQASLRGRAARWLRRAANRLVSDDEAATDPYGPNVPVAEDVVVMQKYVFDVGRTVDPLEGAERLLRTDLATAAVHASTGLVYNAANRAKLKQHIEEFEQLHALAERHARDQPGLLGTVLRLVRHPVILFRVARSLIGRQSDDDEDDGDEAEDDGFDMAQIPEMILREVVLQAVHHDVDTKVIRPEYRRTDPWIRIAMQPCFLTRPDGERQDVDVGLVLHRTGTAVLTFYVTLDGPFTADELTWRALAFVPAYASTKMASALVDYAATADGMEPRKPSEQTFSSGVWWSRWDHRMPVSLSDVFESYLVAVRAAVNADDPSSPRLGDARSFTPQWHGYSVLSVRRPHAGLRADGPLAAQLGAVVSRNPEWRDARPEHLAETARQDLSFSVRHSYWVETHCAAIVHSPLKYENLVAIHGPDIPGEKWIFDEQYLAAAIDLALVEYHTIVAINSEVENITMDRKYVGELRARMLRARTDLDAESHLTYGDLRAIHRRFRQVRGIEQYWEDAHEKLRLVTDQLDAETEDRRFRSERSLQGVLGITALLVGIPSVAAVVDRVAAVSDVDNADYSGLGRLVRSSADLAADASGPLTVAAIAVLFVLLVVVFLRGRTPPRSGQRLADRAAGPTARRKPYQYFDGYQVAADFKEDGEPIIRIGPPHDPYADPEPDDGGDGEADGGAA